mgnify:CR=1 FL=1
MKVVDLFCGCGGLSLGFEKAGMDVVAGFDNWQDALDVYRRNFTHPAIRTDLSNVEESVEKICQFKPDMIIGGPPCQDFSSAGKRNEDNGRGDFDRVLCSHNMWLMQYSDIRARNAWIRHTQSLRSPSSSICSTHLVNTLTKISLTTVCCERIKHHKNTNTETVNF